jgi:hypothetical protein
VRFAGTYPASCQEKVWPVAYVDPRSYGVRAIEGLWQAMGGQLTGSVRDGRLGAIGNAPAQFSEERSGARREQPQTLDPGLLGSLAKVLHHGDAKPAPARIRCNNH